MDKTKTSYDRFYRIHDYRYASLPVASGTGTSANVASLDVAGKTGTTNYSSKQLAQYKIPESATRDSWFAGYTPQYTMAVWTGYMKDGKDEYISSKIRKLHS